MELSSRRSYFDCAGKKILRRGGLKTESRRERTNNLSAFYYLITCSLVIQQVLYSLVGGKDK